MAVAGKLLIAIHRGMHAAGHFIGQLAILGVALVLFLVPGGVAVVGCLWAGVRVAKAIGAGEFFGICLFFAFVAWVGCYVALMFNRALATL